VAIEHPSADEDLLKRLHELARDQGEESPQRLIEDLARMPSDAVQPLTVLGRSLLVASFLGRCIAEPSSPKATARRWQQKIRSIKARLGNRAEFSYSGVLVKVVRLRG
jgi:hypothetical protein